MILTRVPLYATEETVTRPVLITVANGIKELLGVNKNTYTKFDVKDTIPLKKTKLGHIKIDNNIKYDMLYIEATEVPFEDHELALIPIRPDFRPIYEDKEIRAKFQPIHHPRRVNIRCKYICRSKSTLYAVTDRLKLYTAHDGMYNQHELVYHYSLHTFIGKLLVEINNLKNKRLETALTLEEYINSTFDNRVDLANSIDGEALKSDLIIREAQVGIEGYITDDLSSMYPEYQEDESSWSIEFEYTFVYEKPVSLLLKYPLVIYNTMISKPFRIFYKEKKKSKDAYRTARSSDLYKIVEPDRRFLIRDDNYYVTIPEMDREVLTPPPNFYARMFSILILVDENDPTSLFNIVTDIPRVKFKDHVLKYILEDEFKYITDKYQGLFYIELYKDTNRDVSNEIYMEADGTLKTRLPMDIKSTYRVVFNVMVDLTFLSNTARKRVKSYFAKELEENETWGAPGIIEQAISPEHNIYSNITRKEDEYMSKTYLNLISVDDKYYYKELDSGKRPDEIPFLIKDSKWMYFKTKQIFAVIAYAMDPKD